MKYSEKKLKSLDVISKDECISGVIEEAGFGDDYVKVLESLALHMDGMEDKNGDDVFMELHSRQLYEEIFQFVRSLEVVDNHGVLQEAMVHTKCKTVAKKVKPVAIQLPRDTKEHIKQATKEPGLREPRKIGHKFTKESLGKLKIGGGEFLSKAERKKFLEMLCKHGRFLP